MVLKTCGVVRVYVVKASNDFVLHGIKACKQSVPDDVKSL